MVWQCAELWAWEVQIFEAARLGPGRAASYSILSSTYSFLIFIPIGFGSALTAMLGEALGSGRVERGVGLLKLATLCGFVAVCTYSCPLVLLRSRFAEVLCGGVATVKAELKTALPVILVTQLIDGVLNIFRSWLVVRKLQGFGAIQALLSYYSIGLPLGCFLAFHTGLGLSGLWFGLSAAVLIITLTSAVRIAIDVGKALKGLEEPEEMRDFSSKQASSSDTRPYYSA